MKKISRSALLPYSSKMMFELVNNIESYPEFLPWCGGSSIVESSDSIMVANVVIAKAGVKKSFTTRNTLVPFERIELQLVDGPFKVLFGSWSFHELDADSCKIVLNISFEMKSGVLNIVLSNMFEKITATLVDSFCTRAKDIYGK